MSAQQQQPQQQLLQVHQARATQLQHQQQQQPWWAGPMHGIGSALQGMQHNLQQLANNLPKPPGPHQGQQQQQQPSALAASSTSVSLQQASTPLAAAPAPAPPAAASGSRSNKQPSAVQPVSKEELGRSTWVFLHTLAAQFPERPTRQQQRDARTLVDCLTRIYPCADCAQHFQEIVRWGMLRSEASGAAQN